MKLFVRESYKSPVKGIYPDEIEFTFAAWAGCAPSVPGAKARTRRAVAPICKNLKTGFRNMIITFSGYYCSQLTFGLNGAKIPEGFTCHTQGTDRTGLSFELVICIKSADSMQFPISREPGPRSTSCPAGRAESDF